MSERNVPNYKNLISRLVSSGQWERILETAREWLSVEPENINAHYAAGRTLVTLNRYAEAEPHLTRVLAGSPDHIDSHRLMALIHFMAGRSKAADESIQKAIFLDPTEAASWYELARLCYGQGEKASAKKFAGKALELSPRHPHIMHLLTACEPVGSSNVGQILERYREVLELNPTYAPAHQNIGSCHLQYTGDYQAAEAAFRRALFFNPSDKVARSNLFTTLKQRDRIYRALHAPRDRLLHDFSFLSKDRKVSILYLLTVPYLLFTFLLIGLAFWFLFVWPLVKAYEYLTIGDIRSKAGELGAKRGGFLGYRRWSLNLRLAIYAAILAIFWGGTALFCLKKYGASAKHIWNTVCRHPFLSALIVYGFCLCLILVILFFDKIRRMIRDRRIQSNSRSRAEIFDTLSDADGAKTPIASSPGLGR